jgi:hypothetical protein
MQIIICEVDYGPDPEEMRCFTEVERNARTHPRSPKETRRAQRKGGRRR